MENASKALLMAGGVLIGLLVLGALLLMFNNLSSYQNVNEQNEKEAQLIEFNNQFETYVRDNVRGSDVYTLMNKVVDYNTREVNEGYNKITLTVNMNNNKSAFAADTSSDNKLITQDIYTISGTENVLKTKFINKINEVKKALRRRGKSTKISNSNDKNFSKWK